MGNLSYTVFKEPPIGFQPTMLVSACYLEVDGELLLVKRASKKDEGDLWGVVAGKVEPNESFQEAAIRELYEETSIEVKEMIDLGPLYIQKPHVAYVYQTFGIFLKEKPKVRLAPENSEFCWVKIENIESYPLMQAAKEGLEYFISKSSFLRGSLS